MAAQGELPWLCSETRKVTSLDESLTPQLKCSLKLKRSCHAYKRINRHLQTAHKIKRRTFLFARRTHDGTVIASLMGILS
jgi:predicted nucleic acid binding AN1-type Zn finger protein